MIDHSQADLERAKRQEEGISISNKERNHGQRIVELMQELRAMPEYKLLQRIKILGWSLYIHTANYSQLRKLLAFYSDPLKSLPLWDRKNRHKQDAFQKEVARLLHNYVSSVKTIIDHTRILYQSLYEPNGQLPEYQKRVDKDFANNPLAQFMEDLRNYCIHYKPPPLFSVRTWSKEPPKHESGIELDKQALSEYSNWSSSAKQFLAKQGTTINLLSVIEGYHSVVMDFHYWFEGRLREIHAEDLQNVDAKRKELAELVVPDEVRQALVDIEKEEASLGEAFAAILTPKEWDELKQIPVGSKGYSEKLISFLEAKAPIEEDLKERIRRICVKTK